MRKQINNALSYLKKHKWLRYIIVTATIILLAVLLEMIFSNANTMLINKNNYDKDIELVKDSDLLVPGGKTTTHTLSGMPENVYAIRIGIKTEKTFGEPISLRVDAYDKKLANTYALIESTYLAPSKGETSYRTIFLDYETGSRDNLKLIFSNVYNDAQLCSVIVNPSSTFSFSALRFLLLCFISLIIYNFSFFGLNKEAFNVKKGKHVFVAILTIALCVTISVVFCSVFVGDDGGVRGKTNIDYPLKNNIESYTPYIQQTDAFLKGQLHLDAKVSNELLALENPYDNSQRNGVPYMWDRAMYEGKYFSYFGIGPILNIYLPHYLLTGSLPTDTLAVCVYAVMATLFTCMFLYAFVVIYKKSVSVSLLSISSVCITFCSGVLLMARSTAHFYYLAVIAGMAYLAQFLFFIIVAINCSNKVARPIFFGLSSLAYGFILLSRLNIALLTAFIVIPLVIYGVIFNRTKIDIDSYAYTDVKRTTKGKIIDLACLGSFTLIAVIFTLCYNYLRFDSIFEFGTKYQLTVSDISQNSITGTNFVEFIYHYFIHPFETNGIFPYFRLTTNKLYSYGTYWYVDTGMGLFAIPIMLGLFFSIGLFTNKNKSGFAKCLSACALFGAFVVSFINFYLGGVIYRYTCDITLLCAIMAVMFMFSFNERISEGDGAITIYRLEKAFMVISIFVCFIASVSIHGYLADYDAGVFISLLNAFS